MKISLKCHKYLKGKNYLKTNSFVVINSPSNNLNNFLKKTMKKRFISHSITEKNSIGNTLSKISTFANSNFRQIKTSIFSSKIQSENSGNKRVFMHSLLKESGTTVAFRLKKSIYCPPQLKQVTSLKLRNVSKYFTDLLTLCTKLLLITKLFKNFEAM